MRDIEDFWPVTALAEGWKNGPPPLSEVDQKMIKDFNSHMESSEQPSKKRELLEMVWMLFGMRTLARSSLTAAEANRRGESSSATLASAARLTAMELRLNKIAQNSIADYLRSRIEAKDVSGLWDAPSMMGVVQGLKAKNVQAEQKSSRVSQRTDTVEEGYDSGDSQKTVKAYPV